MQFVNVSKRQSITKLLLTGKYWERTMVEIPCLEFIQIKEPSEVFGVEASGNARYLFNAYCSVVDFHTVNRCQT